MFFWNSLAFSMIQWMLAIWTLVPLPFLNPVWTSGSSWFTYCWSLAWRILSKLVLNEQARMNKLVLKKSWWLVHWDIKPGTWKVCVGTFQTLYPILWLESSVICCIYKHWCGVSCSVMSNSATPWTLAHQAPLSMEFSRHKYWSRLPFSSLGDLPDPGVKPKSPALQADSFSVWATREAHIQTLSHYYLLP